MPDVKNCIEQKKRELYLIKRAGSSFRDVVSASLPFIEMSFVLLTRKTLSTKVLRIAYSETYQFYFNESIAHFQFFLD